MPAIQPDRAQHVAGVRWPRRRIAEGMGSAEGLGVIYASFRAAAKN